MFFASVAFKFIELRNKENVTFSLVFNSFFGELRKLENAIHLMLRSMSFFALIYLTILTADYAARAEINYGIITSLGNAATVITALVFWIFFREALNKLTMLGIGIVIAGICMISLSNTG